MHGSAFLRWMLWLKVDGGFEDSSSHSWDMVWAGLGYRGVVSRGAAAQACLLMAAELGTRQSSSVPHIWKRLGMSSQPPLHRWSFQKELICLRKSQVWTFPTTS